MSDHSTPHHDNTHDAELKKSRTASRAAFWFMLIVAGLFVATLNFIEIMGQSHGHHESSERTYNESVQAGGTSEHAGQAAPATTPAPSGNHDSAGSGAAH
ncbi:MAG: hypothetical protein JST06_11275 [Bacteroidetes bacterium]|nr:hypothetical protein [Bacteroidota bacterium]MBS1629594.1 hypothetical protein [Bacteroidota bacterium]